ncbi:hypothetical protein TNIN_77801 [Trichonephila inaurata madagascariensis]|uniref:Uncharacterized protein n=1 Tax=Trichonephila inaurata madagascariensis TaxID=2747483 RepID=A0A8X7BP04_9ARAC|nr:hypothetical protein TNIN_77801 [Trichonephila inaurata madagascariensis]
MDLPIDDDVNGLILRRGMALNNFDNRCLEHCSICDDLDCPIEWCMIFKSTSREFVQQPPEEILPGPQFGFQHNAPSTSGNSFQD